MEAQSLRYPDVHLLPWLQPACVVHTCTLWSYIQAVTGTDLTEPDLNIVLNFYFFFWNLARPVMLGVSLL